MNGSSKIFCWVRKGKIYPFEHSLEERFDEIEKDIDMSVKIQTICIWIKKFYEKLDEIEKHIDMPIKIQTICIQTKRFYEKLDEIEKDIDMPVKRQTICICPKRFYEILLIKRIELSQQVVQIKVNKY